jgi:hypothetical protein
VSAIQEESEEFMKPKFNIQVREVAEKYRLYLWEVAQIMGISYSGLMQKMRHDWTPEEQQSVIQMIEEYVKKGSSNGE